MCLNGEGVENLKGLCEVYRGHEVVDLWIPKVVAKDQQRLLYIPGLTKRYHQLSQILNPVSKVCSHANTIFC